ncbi:hypothetical protein EST38_g5110 [Candolleomyces aberdarensis]|uniref:Dolichyl-diphosphooligosaccharide-protein glycotransferase n=1 Tax=Candolleomyces aberdarensis TaxID=2316362 RepID=A0A4Q2DP49_9AGAR|nr:hypothetical protein EST38_g5110 [Candolleomyces aberdarensis]
MKGLFSSLFLCLGLVYAQQDSLKKLTELAAAGNGVIHLDSQSFDLLTSPKRTWSASIQFTALSKNRNCVPCKEFDPAFSTVGKAWSSVQASDRDQHFFATLDFDNAPNVFQKLSLASAPVVFAYPAADGPRKPASGRTAPTKYDFQDGFDAGPLAQHLSKFTPVPIPYKAPIDWAKWFTTAIAIIGVGSFLRLAAPVVFTRWTWAFGSVIVMLIMTGGYMFTRIRGVPYVGRDGNWIAAGFSNQYGQEVHVVAFVYGLLAFSFVMLTLIVPYQTSPAKQRMQVYLWGAVVIIIYSVLVSLFRVKNRGYPYKLLL